MTGTLEERTQNLKEKLLAKKQGHYTLVGGFTKVTEKATFKHVDCGYVWDTTPRTLFSSKDPVNGGCPKCQYDEKRLSKEEFELRVKKHTKGKYILSGEPIYKGTGYKAGFIHKECGTHFVMTAESIFFNEVSCPKCFSEMPSPITGTREDFEKRLYNKYHGEYILSPNSGYTKLLDKVEMIHTTCGTHWTTRASHALYDSGCPKCNQSKGEILIDGILKKNGVSYIRQFTIPECKNHRVLPFDFAITVNGRYIGLIEYDGIQHFMSFSHFGGAKKFAKQQKNDKIKTDFCKSEKIPLLRVKYTLSKEQVAKKVMAFVTSIESKAEGSSPKGRAKI